MCQTSVRKYQEYPSLSMLDIASDLGASGWRLAARQAAADVLCVLIDVAPALLQPAAQIVQAGLAVGSTNQSVLGTLTIAGKQILALAAVQRKRVELGEAEFLLFLGEDHARTRGLHNVAQLVPGINVVVALPSRTADPPLGGFAQAEARAHHSSLGIILGE